MHALFLFFLPTKQKFVDEWRLFYMVSIHQSKSPFGFGCDVVFVGVSDTELLVIIEQITNND